MIIDTHAHIDKSNFKQDYKEVISSVGKIIIPAIETANVKKIIKLSEEFETVYFAIGEHPNSREKYKKEVIEELSAHEKCVAIGECGLDWFRIQKGISLKEEKDRQIKLFIEQIEYSIEYDLPLIIHTRAAEEDVKDILLSYPEAKGVIHGFNGHEELIELKDHGWYFGIGGMITYEKCTTKEQLKKIPEDKILIETDSPYLTPFPLKGRNEPKFLDIVIKEIAGVINKGQEDVEKLTAKNSLKLFRRME
jgi:TatD DNase family protein